MVKVEKDNTVKEIPLSWLKEYEEAGWRKHEPKPKK